VEGVGRQADRDFVHDRRVQDPLDVVERAQDRAVADGRRTRAK
jgi:hypothetical protein